MFHFNTSHRDTTSQAYQQRHSIPVINTNLWTFFEVFQSLSFSFRAQDTRDWIRSGSTQGVFLYPVLQKITYVMLLYGAYVTALLYTRLYDTKNALLELWSRFKIFE